MWNPLGSKVYMGAGDTPKAIRAWLNARFDNIIALFGLTSTNGVRRAMMRDDMAWIAVPVALPGVPGTNDLGKIAIPAFGAGRCLLHSMSWYAAWVGSDDIVVEAVHPNGTTRQLASVTSSAMTAGLYAIGLTDVTGMTIRVYKTGAAVVTGSQNGIITLHCLCTVAAEV